MTKELRFDILDLNKFQYQEKTASSRSVRHERGVKAPVVPTSPPTTAQIGLAVDAQKWILDAVHVRDQREGVIAEEDIVTEFVSWCDALLTERYASPDASNAWQAYITNVALLVADIALLADPKRYYDVDAELLPFLQRWGRRSKSNNIQASTAVGKRRLSARNLFQFTRVFAEVIGNSAHFIPIFCKSPKPSTCLLSYLLTSIDTELFAVGDIESFKESAAVCTKELQQLDDNAFGWFDPAILLPILLRRPMLNKKYVSLLIKERLRIPPPPLYQTLELYPLPNGGTATQKRLRELHQAARAEITTLKPTFDSLRGTTEDRLFPACAHFAQEAAAYVVWTSWRSCSLQLIVSRNRIGESIGGKAHWSILGGSHYSYM